MVLVPEGGTFLGSNEPSGPSPPRWWVCSSPRGGRLQNIPILCSSFLLDSRHSFSGCWKISSQRFPPCPTPPQIPDLLAGISRIEFVISSPVPFHPPAFPMSFFFFINTTLFIYFFGCVGSSFRARAFSSCGKWGPLFIAVRGPFTIAAPPVAGHRLQTRRLSSCGSRAQLLHGMWDLPRPGLEPVSPALAGRLSTTAPPRKPSCVF